MSILQTKPHNLSKISKRGTFNISPNLLDKVFKFYDDALDSMAKNATWHDLKTGVEGHVVGRIDYPDFFREVLNGTPSIKGDARTDIIITVMREFPDQMELHLIAYDSRSAGFFSPADKSVRLGFHKDFLSREKRSPLKAALFHELHHAFEDGISSTFGKPMTGHDLYSGSPSEQVRSFISYLSEPHEQRAYAAEMALQASRQDVVKIKQMFKIYQQARSQNNIQDANFACSQMREIVNPNSIKLMFLAQGMKSRFSEWLFKVPPDTPQELKNELRGIAARIAGYVVSAYQAILKREAAAIVGRPHQPSPTFTLPSTIPELTAILTDNQKFDDWIGQPASDQERQDIRNSIKRAIIAKFPSNPAKAKAFVRRIAADSSR